MVGDREKCIQASMDEYLSKPLKQNQLIQTIVKCATLGGALAAQGDQRNSLSNSPQDVKMDNDQNPFISVEEPKTSVDEKTPRQSPLPATAGAMPPRRPKIEPRAFTERETAGGESPQLMSVDVVDNVDRVS